MEFGTTTSEDGTDKPGSSKKRASNVRIPLPRQPIDATSVFNRPEPFERQGAGSVSDLKDIFGIPKPEIQSTPELVDSKSVVPRQRVEEHFMPNTAVTEAQSAVLREESDESKEEDTKTVLPVAPKESLDATPISLSNSEGELSLSPHQEAIREPSEPSNEEYVEYMPTHEGSEHTEVVTESLEPVANMEGGGSDEPPVVPMMEMGPDDEPEDNQEDATSGRVLTPQPTTPNFSWHNTMPASPNTQPNTAPQVNNPNTLPANPNVVPATYAPLPASPNTAPQAQMQPNVLTSFNPNVQASPNTIANRNFLAGILVGGTVEHFRHRRREKKQRKQQEKQAKRMEGMGREQTELERRLNQYKQSASGLKQSVGERLQQLSTRQEYMSRRSGEQQSQLEKLLAAQKLASVEKIPDQPETPEQVEVPSDRRIETSSWHRIEIDKKTGRPVEHPTLEYGHEFQREQHQEYAGSAQDDVNGQNSQTPTLGIVATTTDTPLMPRHEPSVQHGQIPPVVNTSSSAPDDSWSAAPQSAEHDQVSPAMWGVLAVIVLAIVFLLV